MHIDKYEDSISCVLCPTWLSPEVLKVCCYKKPFMSIQNTAYNFNKTSLWKFEFEYYGLLESIESGATIFGNTYSYSELQDAMLG